MSDQACEPGCTISTRPHNGRRCGRYNGAFWEWLGEEPGADGAGWPHMLTPPVPESEPVAYRWRYNKCDWRLSSFNAEWYAKYSGHPLYEIRPLGYTHPPVEPKSNRQNTIVPETESIPPVGEREAEVKAIRGFILWLYDQHTPSHDFAKTHAQEYLAGLALTEQMAESPAVTEEEHTVIRVCAPPERANSRLNGSHGRVLRMSGDIVTVLLLDGPSKGFERQLLAGDVVSIDEVEP